MPFPLLSKVEIGDDPKTIFDGVNLACLVGARPRTKGMERRDLLEANGGIFKPQGQALNDNAADDVKVLVTGNPANTNALIAMRNAPDIPAERFNALTRLDHNRAKAQLAAKTGASVNDITHMTIWGNHSATQYPDLFNALVRGQNAAELINDQEWLESTFLPTVQQRGSGRHRGARRQFGRKCRQRDDRAHAGLGPRDARGRLGVNVGPLRWLLSGPGGPDLLIPVHTQWRRLPDRAGPGDQRLLPQQDRRQRGRAD